MCICLPNIEQDYDEYKAYMNGQNQRNLRLWMLWNDHRLEQFQHYQRLMEMWLYLCCGCIISQ
jgi:hypothetical protein